MNCDFISASYTGNKQRIPIIKFPVEQQIYNLHTIHHGPIQAMGKFWLVEVSNRGFHWQAFGSELGNQ